MKSEDEGIQAVRDARRKISTRFEDDPQKLIEHYMAEQEKYRDRLVRPGHQTGVSGKRAKS